MPNEPALGRGAEEPVSNPANNVTAHVCTLAAWLPELLVGDPRNNSAQEM
jgi:hypothetical protein